MLETACLILPLLVLLPLDARAPGKTPLQRLTLPSWHNPSLWKQEVVGARPRHQENITKKLLGDWSKANVFMAGMRSWEMPAGRGGVEEALTVSCRRKRMVAQVRKDILLAFGYSTAKLTLRDPQCKAESNRSHFLLDSPLTSCGTLRLVDVDSAPSIVLYQNAILLRRFPRGLLHGNGSVDTPRASKEDPKVINFTCVYPVLTLPRSSDLGGVPDLPPRSSRSLFSLEVCSSHISSKHRGPCIMASNSRVFVEVFLSPLDPSVGFSLQMCFVSPSSDPWVPSDFLLVCGACPADPSVTFSTQRPASRERRRFSFQLRPVYNESIQFLHCWLALHPGEDADQACTGEEPEAPGVAGEIVGVAACTGAGERANRSNIRIVSKPMIVTMGGEVRVKGGQVTPSPVSGWKSSIMKDGMRSDVHVGLMQSAKLHQGLGLDAIVGIVFAAFVIGALLMAGLWFIYSQTDPDTASVLAPPSTLVLEKVVKDNSGCTTHVWEIPRAQ